MSHRMQQAPTAGWVKHDLELTYRSFQIDTLFTGSQAEVIARLYVEDGAPML